MSNIRACQCKILERTSKTPILSWIREESTLVRRELAACVNRRGTRVVVEHASTLEQVDSILALREKHPGGGPGDRNTEEVGQIPEICHGELTM
jgi:hypothetical protein